LASLASGAIVTGTVTNSSDYSNFVYLSKFCYDYTTGVLHDTPGGAVELRISPLDPTKPVLDKSLHFWMFDDEASSWPALKFKGATCKSLIKSARGVFQITLDPQVCGHFLSIFLMSSYLI